MKRWIAWLLILTLFLGGTSCKKAIGEDGASAGEYIEGEEQQMSGDSPDKVTDWETLDPSGSTGKPSTQKPNGQKGEEQDGAPSVQDPTDQPDEEQKEDVKKPEQNLPEQPDEEQENDTPVTDPEQKPDGQPDNTPPTEDNEENLEEDPEEEDPTEEDEEPSEEDAENPSSGTIVVHYALHHEEGGRLTIRQSGSTYYLYLYPETPSDATKIFTVPTELNSVCADIMEEYVNRYMNPDFNRDAAV